MIMQPSRTVSDELTEIPPGMRFLVTLDTEGRIGSLGAGLARLLGYDATELTGEYIESLAHTDVPAALFVDMWRDLRTGRPWSGVIKNQCRNGDPGWARMMVVPIRTHGRVVSYIATFERALSREIDSAALAYRHVAESNDGSTFVHGRFASGGLGARIARKVSALSLRARLAGGVVLALVPTVLIAVLALLFVTGRYEAAASLAVVFVVMSMLAGLGTGVIWWRLERRLAAGLRFADTAISRMADGDFIAPIDCGRDDEVGRLLQTLAELQVRLGHDMQRGNDPLHRALAPGSPADRDAQVHADALGRIAGRLVSHGEQLVSRSEAQVSAIDRMVALAHELSEAGLVDGTVSFEDDSANGVRRALNAVSVELDAVGQELKPDSTLLSDTELLAFELKLLALNFTLAHNRDERVGLPVLAAEARDRAHDAGLIVSSLRRMLSQLRSRLARGRSLLSGAGETLVAPEALRLPDVDGASLQAPGKLWGELQDMLEAARSNRVVTDQIVLLALDLKTMLQVDPEAESGGRKTSDRIGQSSTNTDVHAGVLTSAAEDASVKSSDLSLQFARSSAKISRLRPARHEVGTPVPRVRRTAVQGQSIEDEWGTLRE